MNQGKTERGERYGLAWHGRSRAHRLADAPSEATLQPCRDESIRPDETENLFIEGDNLDALKILRQSHPKQVKLI